MSRTVSYIEGRMLKELGYPETDQYFIDGDIIIISKELANVYDKDCLLPAPDLKACVEWLSTKGITIIVYPSPGYTINFNGISYFKDLNEEMPNEVGYFPVNSALYETTLASAVYMAIQMLYNSEKEKNVKHNKNNMEEYKELETAYKVLEKLEADDTVQAQRNSITFCKNAIAHKIVHICMNMELGK